MRARMIIDRELLRDLLKLPEDVEVEFDVGIALCGDGLPDATLVEPIYQVNTYDGITFTSFLRWKVHEPKGQATDGRADKLPLV